MIISASLELRKEQTSACLSSWTPQLLSLCSHITSSNGCCHFIPTQRCCRGVEWEKGAAYTGKKIKPAQNRCSQLGTSNARCQSGASLWFINPKGRVMGGWWAPPCSFSGKALVVSDVVRWWQSKIVSFPHVLGTSCILFPPQSSCPSLSYCLCDKHILLKLL